MHINLKKKKVFVSGHNGLAGSAIVRKLEKDSCSIITADRQKLDLLKFENVEKFFLKFKPDFVINAAGIVGGIAANIEFPVSFIQDNITIQDNIFRSSYKYGVKRLIFLGSSCIYPKNCQQPIKEEFLLDGDLEKTNEYYALAKIVGIKTCEAYNKQFSCEYISVMPTNLYGPNDNFNQETSHVPAALIDRFHNAKKFDLDKVVIWGNGETYREFMHSDDFADACIFVLKNYSNSKIINIGTGVDISIRDFAHLIKEIVGYKGEIIFDNTKPTGAKKKLLDISKLKKLGWESRIDLRNGMEDYYDWYLSNIDKLRR